MWDLDPSGPTPFHSAARNVGHISPCGDQEEAGTTMGHADVGSFNSLPRRIVPCFGKVPEYGIDSSIDEAGHVLHDDVVRSNLANASRHFKPEDALLAFMDSLSI